MVNDYFLVVAVPALFVGAGLLQSTLNSLYLHETSTSHADQETTIQSASAGPRLTAVIEMLWIVIYCVKFCFLAQFKFHKPPYAYVSIYLTRYYWVSIGICTAGLLFTLVQPIILCSHPGKLLVNAEVRLEDTNIWQQNVDTSNPRALWVGKYPSLLLTSSPTC